MNKPPYKKPLNFLLCLLVLIFLGATVMLFTVGTFDVVILFLFAMIVEVVIVFIFLIFFSFYYRWARQWLLGLSVITTLFLLNIFKDDIIDTYASLRTPKKYQKYPVLNEVVPYRSGDKIISFLSKNKKTDSYCLLNQKNELIQFDYHYDDFYKYNTQGDVIDSLNIKKHNYKEKIFVGDYFLYLDENKVVSWAIDGDTLPKPVPIMQESLKWNNDQRISFFKKLLQTASYYYVYDRQTDDDVTKDLNPMRHRGKVFFYNGLQWQFLYVPLYDKKMYDNDFTTSRGENILLFDDTKATNMHESTKRGMIRPQYVASNDRFFYADLTVDGAVFHFKYSYWGQSERETMRMPTFCFERGVERLETFANLKVYSNPKLSYKLFYAEGYVYKIRDKR